MATIKTVVTSAAWSDLGAGPLLVELLGPGTAAIVVDTAAPTSLTADAQIISQSLFNNAQTFGTSATHVYALAVNSATVTVAVSPSAAGGGTGGGGGAATIADGADVAQGAKADAAATNSTSSWSVVALLKGLYAALLAPTPAGTNNIGSVTVSNGASTFAETPGAIAASATFLGPSHDMGGVAGPYSWFNVFASTPGGAAFLYAQFSADGTTWTTYDSSSSAVPSSSFKQLSYRVMGRYNRVVFTNGSTAQTPIVATSYTVN